MRYRWFERVLLIVGGAAILATIPFGGGDGLDPVEVLAQLLLFGVLVGAAHWGRRGGVIAATLASLVYVTLRAPLIAGADSFSPDLLLPLLTRFAAFGVVGVVGGELCNRVKYFMSEIEDDARVDLWTRVFNQRHIHALLSASQSEHVRYGAPYSVVTLTITPSLLSDLRPTKQRAVLRAVADHIRHDVRLVDDVARLDDGRFLILLPHTPRQGALVAGERVRTGVRDVLGAKDSSLTIVVLGTEEDAEALLELQREIEPADAQATASA